LVLILGDKFLGPVAAVAPLVLWITVLLALASGLDYFFRFYKKVSGTDAPAENQA
jgi:hypothetical protein